MEPRSGFLEDAGDVLSQLSAWAGAGRDSALVVITDTQGGAARAPGALMAVRDDGSWAGYISGGCIDADVALHAVEAMRRGAVKQLRYGAGSPFIDIKLPCGGAIDVMILPKPRHETVSAAAADLQGRRAVALAFNRSGEVKHAALSTTPGRRDDGFVAHYAPKLRLRIAGRGADCFALARLARASDIHVHLQLSHDADLETARALGYSCAALTTPRDIPALSDDAWTAFALMFHDQDWEVPLIAQALTGPAFYVGAVGSRRAHEQRCAELIRKGCSAHQVARLRGPVGLVPSMRSASMLGLSALAEMAGDYQRLLAGATRSTAVLLLAAGASSRFDDGDKLLASLGGQPMLAHAARLLASRSLGARIAVVGADQGERRRLLERHGWTVVENAEAAHGQATSLVAGVKTLAADPQIERVLILLGDMPFVTDAHLETMLRQGGVDALMSETSEAHTPPALFSRSCFDSLLALRGDQGARSVYSAASNRRAAPIPTPLAGDIDTAADLAHAQALSRT